MTTPNNTLQQQQQAAQAHAMQQAQKAAKPQSSASVKFAEVLKGQQGATSTSKMLKTNPVGGQEVIKAALKNNTGGGGKSRLSTAVNANTGASSGASGGASSSSSATGTTGTSDAAKETASLLQMGQDMNLQYLQLQESMQSESRQYTAMSNVSKTKSDTAKNSLSNVK